MTWSVLFFLFFFHLGKPLARLHLPINEKSWMRMPNLWRERWRDPSRQRLSRLCFAKATWRGTKSLRAISDRLVFTAARHRPFFSCSSSGHPTDCPTTWPRGEIRRPLRDPARCIPMQISLALGTRHNRRNFMLLRNSTCSPYISSLLRSFLKPDTFLPHPPTQYLIIHPRVLWSALIFHCWSERNNRIVSGS